MNVDRSALTPPEIENAPLRHGWRPFRLDWVAWTLIVPALGIASFAFLAPLVTFFRYSVWTYSNGTLRQKFSLSAFTTFISSPYWHQVLLTTLVLAFVTTALGLLVGYPIAFALWKLRSVKARIAVAIIVFSPLVISTVVRAYGWEVLLSDHGPVNVMLGKIRPAGSGPVTLIYNLNGVLIALIQLILPFLVFPIYVSLSKVSPSLADAAEDLGAGWLTVFRRVTLPLSMPGVVTAINMTFSIGLGIYVVPSMLGGGRVQVLSIAIFNSASSVNWPAAAVCSMVLLLIACAGVVASRQLLRISSFD
jgi:putative spermidine/putrescine transport system permease protein